jgi:hypothetical protein
MAGDCLTIDKEFAELCGQQTPEELNLLEQSLIDHGCLDPIILWANHDDTILDGHTRYRLCGDNQISFKTKSLTFKTREDARNWIIDNQLCRRNLSEERKAYLRGKRYNAEKREKEETLKQNNQKGQNVPTERTSAKLAAQFDVDEKTIRRDAKFADAVDAIEKNVGKPVKDEILSGHSGLSKKEVVAIAQQPAEKQAAAVDSAKRDKPKTGEIKTDVDRLIEGIEGLIEKVNAMAARRMGHNDKSRAVVATLKEAIQDAKAMARSWRNK